jgi:hypothetical protein
MDRTKQRLSHRKSRNGCAVCKSRHIKCDEARPACGNCRISEKKCYYLTSNKHKLTPPPYEQELTTSIWLQTATTSLVPVSTPSVELRFSEVDELFTLDHMKLFRHVEKDMWEWMMVTKHLRPLEDFYVSSALETPYLMSQLLALAAMHLSTAEGDSSAWYLSQAIRLRQRALQGFNDSLKDTSASKVKSQFLFSSLFGLHYLAENVAGAPEQEFAETFAAVVEYLRVNRGPRIMGDRSWEMLCDSPINTWFRVLNEELNTPCMQLEVSFNSFDLIAAMLRVSDLNQESIAACESARQALESVQRRMHGPKSWGVHALMAWSSLIPLRFIGLLEKQIPEALVILAHYAVGLHQFREFWCLGETGNRLFQGIAKLLASYWAVWLPQFGSEL